jgi:hypothetical protein
MIQTQQQQQSQTQLDVYGGGDGGDGGDGGVDGDFEGASGFLEEDEDTCTTEVCSTPSTHYYPVHFSPNLHPLSHCTTHISPNLPLLYRISSLSQAADAIVRVVPTVWTYAALGKLDELQLWNDEMVHMLKVSSSTPTTHHPPLPYSSSPFTLTFPFCLPSFSQVCFPDSDGLGGSSVLAPSQKKTYMRATFIRNLFNVLCSLRAS